MSFTSLSRTQGDLTCYERSQTFNAIWKGGKAMIDAIAIHNLGSHVALLLIFYVTQQRE